MTTTLTEKTFAQLFTYSGAGAGTCVNAQGWIQPSAAPRFDHDPVTKAAKGLLIESARTNLMPYASRLESWSVNSLVSVQPEAAISPNGRYDACKVVLGAAAVSGTPFITRAITKAAGAVQYTVSAYFKAAGLVGATFMLTGASAADRVNFELNLDVKSVITNVFGGFTGASAKIVEAGNGWIRVEGTVTSDAGTGAAARIYPKSGSGGVIDGVSGIYVWGVQLEEGPFASSFVPSIETFTGRTSLGSYYDAIGVLRTAAAGAARLSYEPSNPGLAPVLLLEGQSTNLVLKSGDIHLPPWTGAGFQRTAGRRAPDGTLRATEISGTPVGSLGTQVVATATVMTFSVYLKNVSRDAPVAMQLRNTSTSAQFAFGHATLHGGNPSIAGAGWEMRSVGDGWFRCSFTQRSGISVGDTIIMYPFHVEDGADHGAFLIWGGQMEAGSYPTSYIPSTETFTGRASVGTYFDSTGAMKVATAGAARMTYNPADLSIAPWLLLEGGSTNLLVGSQITSGTPAGTTPPTVASVTVDGEACMATTFTPANGAGYGATRASGNATAAVTQGTIYSISTYVKLSRALTGNEAITVYYTGSSGLAAFVLNAANSGQFIDRFTRAVPPKVSPAATGTIYPVVHTNTAVTSSLTVWICKGQVEAGMSETSYIPTTTAAVTRAADASTSAATTRAADTQTSGAQTRSADTVRIDASKGWFNPAEGTVAIEFKLPAALEAPTRTVLEFGGTGVGNRTGIGYQVNGSVYAYCNVNGAGVSTATMMPIGPNTKVSLSYGTDGLRLGCNGEPLKKGGPNGVPPIPLLGLGCTATGGNQPTFHIRDVKYFPQRLTDAEVVALTA